MYVLRAAGTQSSRSGESLRPSFPILRLSFTSAKCGRTRAHERAKRVVAGRGPGVRDTNAGGDRHRFTVSHGEVRIGTYDLESGAAWASGGSRASELSSIAVVVRIRRQPSRRTDYEPRFL